MWSIYGKVKKILLIAQKNYCVREKHYWLYTRHEYRWSKKFINIQDIQTSLNRHISESNQMVTDIIFGIQNLFILVEKHFWIINISKFHKKHI